MTRKQRELIDQARSALDAVEAFKTYLSKQLEAKRVETLEKLELLAKESRATVDEARARGTLPIAMIRLHRCEQLLYSVIQLAAEYIEVYNQARLLGLLKR